MERDHRLMLRLLLLLLVASVIAACFGDGANNTAVEAQAGLAWVEGTWLEPPFTVEAGTDGVRVNGRLVSEPPTPPEEDGQATTSALSSALAVAAERLIALGDPGPEPPDQAALREIASAVRALPDIAEVMFEPGELHVTDTMGNEGSIVLVRPLLPEGSLAARFEEEARRWSEAFSAGDLVLFARDVVIEVPAQQRATFVSDVAAVFDLPVGEQQDERMLDVVGSLAASQVLLDAGRPPAPIVARGRRETGPGLATLAPVSVDLVSAVPGGAFPSARSPGVGSHGRNRTPTSNKAYLFQPISVEGPDWCAPDPVIRAAKLHGYQVVHLRGTASTVDEVVASSGRAGIFWRCAHGSTLEPAKDSDDADRRVAAYRRRGLKGIFHSTAHSGGKPYHYVAAWPEKGFYPAHWKSANSIVVLSTCMGQRVVPDMAPREAIAVAGVCYPQDADHKKAMAAFWGRLAGTVDAGYSRPVGEAYRRTFAGTVWKHTGNGHTVLSPAVADAMPLTVIPVSPNVPIRAVVVFDAAMDRTVTSVAERILRIEDGCGAKVASRRWIDAYTFELTFTTTDEGPLFFVIDSTWATSADDLALKLDGNQDPKDRDHVGPNHDNYEWAVECLASLPTPTPAASVLTPTPASAVGGGAGTAVPTGSAVAPTATAAPITPTPTVANALQPPPAAPSATPPSTLTVTPTATASRTPNPTPSPTPISTSTPTATPSANPTSAPLPACNVAADPPTLASVEVVPGSATAGAQIAVCGLGFVPGETVVVSFAGPTLGAAVADDLGAFRIVGTLPSDVPPGSHPMEVQGDGGSLVELSYTVLG